MSPRPCRDRIDRTGIVTESALHTPEARAKAVASAAAAKSVAKCLQFITKGQEGYHGATLIEARLEEMPQKCRLNYVKGMQGNSLAASVKAFCLMCVGWQRKEATRCTDPACPLYPHRPFQD